MERGTFAFRRGALALAALSLAATPAPALAAGAAEPFSAPRDEASYGRALQCLTQAIYYEARSESADGQRAVAQVVLNRVRHPSYPNSVCGVVYQGSHRRTGCQFTFTCDGSIRGYVDAAAWSRAQQIAGAALAGYVYRPVGLAVNYHTTAIRPYWAPSLVRQAVIGAHIFYLRPDSATAASFYQAPSAVEPHAGYGAVQAVARTPRTPAARLPVGYQTARVERAVVQQARVERPTVQRAVVERPTIEGRSGVRTARPQLQRASATVSQRPAQAQPASVSRGPRTTIENGVRVARGG